MREPIVAGVLALAFAITFLKSGPASAYCNKSTCDPEKETCERDKFDCVSSGHGYVWTERPIPYRFHAAGSDRLDNRAARIAVRRAFQTWENVDCRDGPTSLAFVEKDESDTELEPGRAAPHDYAIYFRDDGWSGGAADLAVTRHDGGLETGKVWGASIEVNTANKSFRLDGDAEGQYDFEAVMIHEVGHYLGLDHSTASTVMAASYCNDESPCPKSTTELRTLGDDDIAAVCRLYPPMRVALNPSASCTACPPTQLRRETLGPAALVLPLVAALRRRRARQRLP